MAQARRHGLPLVVLDTDLVSTMVYSRHYYGDCPEWIEREARERLGDLYLLHHVDVDWVADGHQRGAAAKAGGALRALPDKLRSFDAPVCDVVGSWDERSLRAIDAVDRLLSRLED